MSLTIKRTAERTMRRTNVPVHLLSDRGSQTFNVNAIWRIPDSDRWDEAVTEGTTNLEMCNNFLVSLTSDVNLLDEDDQEITAESVRQTALLELTEVVAAITKDFVNAMLNSQGRKRKK